MSAPLAVPLMRASTLAAARASGGVRLRDVICLGSRVVVGAGRLAPAQPDGTEQQLSRAEGTPPSVTAGAAAWRSLARPATGMAGEQPDLRW